MYDVIVIGAGTAGLTAAIYVRRAGKSVLVLEEKMYGGQIVNTPGIENYPGYENISGFEFSTKLYNQAVNLGMEYKNEAVTDINAEGRIKNVVTTSGSYRSLAVIIATGAKNRTLGIEKNYVGRGVSYCATCDGMFFRGKDVAVNGGGNTAVEDALFLSNYCNKVYLIHRRDSFRAEKSAVDNLLKKDNIEMVLNSIVTALSGESMLESIKVSNAITEEEKTIPVSGLFVAIGQEPDNKRFADIVKLDEKGYIVAKEDCKTSAEGIFAAGDCRTKSVRQLVTAAGDGAVAALAAVSYCMG